MSNTNLWRKLAMMLCLVSVLGFTACDDDDEDEVEVFDKERFFSDFNRSNLFEDADTDRDNFFNENEFNMNFFNTFDTNDNGMIDQNELNMATNDFRLNTAGMNFTTLDTNADGNLDMNEFQPGFMTNNFFTTFDANTDARIAEREFTDGVFDRLDRDGDGMFSENEFNTFNNRFFGF